MNLYLFAAYAAALILLVGTVLIRYRNRFEERQSNGYAKFLADDMLPEIQKMLLNTMEKGMDLMPDKIAEAKRQIEKEL